MANNSCNGKNSCKSAGAGKVTGQHGAQFNSDMKVINGVHQFAESVGVTPGTGGGQVKGGKVMRVKK